MKQKHRGEKPAPLDGNAAAGLLSELFTIDITAAVITCGGCGTTARIGEVSVYGGAMGAVFRCATCDTVMMRLVRNRAGYWFEMQGAKKLAAKSAAN
jgi:uncharacterized protein DUF6510